MIGIKAKIMWYNKSNFILLVLEKFEEVQELL